jgi:hypothetical protein
MAKPIDSAITKLRDFETGLTSSKKRIEELKDTLDGLGGAALGFVAGGYLLGPLGAIAGAAVGAAAGVSGLTEAFKYLEDQIRQTEAAWYRFKKYWDDLQEFWGHGRPSGTSPTGIEIPEDIQKRIDLQKARSQGAPSEPFGSTGAREREHESATAPTSTEAAKPKVEAPLVNTTEAEALKASQKLVEDNLKEELASADKRKEIAHGDQAWSSAVSRLRSKLDVRICGSPVVPRTTGVGATSGTLC